MLTILTIQILKVLAYVIKKIQKYNRVGYA